MSKKFPVSIKIFHPKWLFELQPASIRGVLLFFASVCQSKRWPHFFLSINFLTQMLLNCNFSCSYFDEPCPRSLRCMVVIFTSNAAAGVPFPHHQTIFLLSSWLKFIPRQIWGANIDKRLQLMRVKGQKASPRVAKS